MCNEDTLGPRQEQGFLSIIFRELERGGAYAPDLEVGTSGCVGNHSGPPENNPDDEERGDIFQGRHSNSRGRADHGRRGRGEARHGDGLAGELHSRSGDFEIQGPMIRR